MPTYDEIKAAFDNAIAEVGLVGLKKTSFFASNSKKQ